MRRSVIASVLLLLLALAGVAPGAAQEAPKPPEEPPAPAASAGVLRKGLAKDEALRQAMRAVAYRREWSHPYYWAPFVLVGDPQNRLGRN